MTLLINKTNIFFCRIAALRAQSKTLLASCVLFPVTAEDIMASVQICCCVFATIRVKVKGGG